VCFGTKEATQFRQILQNSLDNAEKKSCRDVSVEYARIADKACTNELTAVGNRVENGITDIDIRLENGGSVKRKRINSESSKTSARLLSISIINTLWILDSISNFTVLVSKDHETGINQYFL
jgi:hypothetical protein